MEFNSENNHGHLLVNYPPKWRVQVGQLAQGRQLAQAAPEYPALVRHYWRAQRLRSGSYFAGSVGGLRCRSSVSTSSSRIVRSSPPVGTAFRIASPPG
ncbi:transposase [Streptomyces sp. NPDC005283]|uniref:transposase n=1 Tax=Streptomyces sp. NPDC005283 TaxID=3156871 RepID=UPI003454EC4D